MKSLFQSGSNPERTVRNMMDKRATLTTLDNDRYPMQWTSAREVLAGYLDR